MSHSRTSTAAERTTEDWPVKNYLKEKESQAGSALLVVLGFLSFMVVSAVAFAIYMRAERLPSSALRRNVATRHLVKAAMAHAMSRVDDAIRLDPFPGVANTNGNNAANFYHDRDENAMDVWYGRVFMPPNPAGLVDDRGSEIQRANEPGSGDFAWRFAPITETVSVLNLEALGYIPPPLVNDVRFLSRSTWTAKWQNFPFDAGRFAFCAVNVSDYLDVNRTKVGLRSSPLDSCISLLGTIVTTKRDNGYYDIPDTVNVNDLPRIANNLTKIFGPDATGRQSYSNPDGTGGSPAGGTVPYISMLDYNLALGDVAYDGSDLVKSLFFPWIRYGGNVFYGSTYLNERATGIQQAMRQPFVTDSFFAASNTTASAEVNFAKRDGQPFPGIDMSSSSLTFNDVVMDSSSKFLKTAFDKGLISSSDIPMIYDYLDHDDVPLSLAMPGVECVPMVTAVEIDTHNFKLKLKEPTKETEPSSIPEKFTGTQVEKTIYKIENTQFAYSGVKVLVAFPFRHFSGRPPEGFRIEATMKVLVTSGAVSLRPTDKLKDLRPNKEWWKNTGNESKPFAIDGGGSGNVLAWTLFGRADIPSWSENRDQEAALKVVPVNFNGSPDAGEKEFFTVFNKREYKDGSPQGEPEKSYQFDLRPFTNGGELLPDGEQKGEISASPYKDEKFRLCAMLWVRIIDPDGKTVDLAPAVLDDDKLNDRNNEERWYQEFFGSTVSSACLLFNSDPNTKSYSYASIAAGDLVGLDDTPSKALATVDPRYNYAPEDWFAWGQSESVSAGTWLDKIQDDKYQFFASEGDRDIFMFTSNQGYLQSLGEFAFLPRLSEWRYRDEGGVKKIQTGSRISPILGKVPDTSAAEHVSEPDAILNRDCAWRTYPAFARFYEACAEVGIGRNSDNVQTVNPFSNNGNVLLAAFANTPCDYWTTGRTVAGAKDMNDDLKAIVDKMGDKNQTSGDAIKDADEAFKSAFCELNEDSLSKMEAKDISMIMRNITSFIRDGDDGHRWTPQTPWEDRYDALPWFSGLDPQDDNSFKEFMGTTLSSCPLYSIDRKFLYSYWRECFANKQQLFLIFVRAESTALGGPGEGTPAQQGGRAVALVWREPTAYDDGNNPQSTMSDSKASAGDLVRQDNQFMTHRRPHRMRVLFYHQFD